MPTITDRFKNAWNAFSGRDPTRIYENIGSASGYRPDRNRLFYSNDRSIIKAVSNRIAIDVASMTIEHVRLDKEKNYKETIDSDLNECLTLSANIDQTGRAFIQDCVMSMFDEGVVAIIPTDIEFDSNNRYFDPDYTESYRIEKMRTAKVVEWYPQHIKARVYNELNGQFQEIVVKKTFAAIVENPLYAIMNEPNSTLQRLIRTYNDLDSINAQSASGKLDLIIQLPYPVRTDIKQQQADHRRKLIEEQLTGSKYGIAYIDGTERITQLNRPVENNLWAQAKDLTQLLFNQLGLTQSIFDGTADEATMLNYYSRTIEPILGAFADEMRRKFLSKKARTTGQSIIYFRDPFKLVPASQLAEIADKFTRNAILSPNEIRAEIGYKPDQDPKSDELRNRNLNESQMETEERTVEYPEDLGEDSEGTDETNDGEYTSLDDLIKVLGGEDV